MGDKITMSPYLVLALPYPARPWTGLYRDRSSVPSLLEREVQQLETSKISKPNVSSTTSGPFSGHHPDQSQKKMNQNAQTKVGTPTLTIDKHRPPPHLFVPVDIIMMATLGTARKPHQHVVAGQRWCGQRSLLARPRRRSRGQR